MAHTVTYQWIKNGTDIPGATGNSYTISNINDTHAGNYSVRVHGDCGVDVISGSAALALHPATVINTQPLDETICTGDPVTFSVDADGASLSYQWKKNGVNILGATGSSYTIAAVAAGDAGDYTVTVSGTCGSVTSGIAKLTVNAAPVITDHPDNITLCTGTNHTFTVTASGANLTYLWRKNGIPILPSETNTSLVINNIDAGDAGTYDVVVTNECGDVTSNGAVLSVATSPVISAHPQDRDQCEGTDVTFTVTATGTNITYQWRKDGNNIAGETAPDLNLTAISLSDAGDYDVIVYGMCDTLISNVAELDCLSCNGCRYH